MTVIASFSVRQHPVMVGDLLLSSTSPNPNTGLLRIPSIGQVNQVRYKESYVIAGLKQKLAVIHPDLAMAWAGSLDKARYVSNKLKQLTSEKEISLDHILNYLHEVENDETLKDLGLILLVSDKQASVVHSLFIRGKGYDTTFYGRVCVAGTGRQDIISLLRTLEHSELSSQTDINPVDLALCFAGSVAANILTWDMTTNYSLAQYYGGGSEIITLSSGKFIKVDKLAYVFWIAYIINPEQVKLLDPLRIIYYSYRQDHLFVHALGFDPSAEKARRTIDNTRYLIDPIYLSETSLDAIDEFERENFYKPNHLVHIVQVVDSSTQRLVGQFHLFRINFETPEITIEFKSDNKFVLTTNTELIKSILNRVAQLTRNGEKNAFK